MACRYTTLWDTPLECGLLGNDITTLTPPPETDPLAPHAQPYYYRVNMLTFYLEQGLELAGLQ